MLGSIVSLCGIGALVGSSLGAYLSKPKDDIDDKINKCLSSVYVINEDGAKSRSCIIKKLSNKEYLISIPIGRSIDDINKCIGTIRAVIGEGFDVSIKLCKDNVAMLELIEIKELPAIVPYEVRSSAPNSITINLGVDIKGSIVSIDLKDNPHTYIVGCTGSGKSNQLRTLLLDLILKYNDCIDLTLIDMKVVELALFKNCRCCERFITDSDDIEGVLSDLLEEAKRRNQLFESLDVVDIYKYNKRIVDTDTLKYKVIVIEEYAILYDNKKAVKLLKKLIAIGRSVGIFIILTVQRCSYDILDNFIKSNISNRIALKTMDSKNSIIAIDTEGSEKLNTGEALIRVGSDLIKYKSYFISTEDLKIKLKPFLKPKEEVAPSKLSNKIPTVSTTKPNNDTINNEVDLDFLDLL